MPTSWRAWGGWIRSRCTRFGIAVEKCARIWWCCEPGTPPPRDAGRDRRRMNPVMPPLRIADLELGSRLILGTGGFANHELLAGALQASGTELCTVALRRLDPSSRGSILDVLR